jgi:hypothetical protein
MFDRRCRVPVAAYDLFSIGYAAVCLELDGECEDVEKLNCKSHPGNSALALTDQKESGALRLIEGR